MRSVYPFRSNIPVQEHALFVQTLDYRGVADLPEHTFLTGNFPLIFRHCVSKMKFDVMSSTISRKR